LVFTNEAYLEAYLATKREFKTDVKLQHSAIFSFNWCGWCSCNFRWFSLTAPIYTFSSIHSTINVT